MYAASVKKGQFARSAFVVIGVAVLIIAAIFLIGKVGGENKAESLADGETSEQREQFLNSLGIEVKKQSSIAEVKVPDTFDERFSEYNAMLKTTGFDLAGYEGKAVKKCTFTVTNRPELGANIGAVLLVSDGKIIAGHLLDLDTSKLYPLGDAASDDGSDAALETILPTQEEQSDETLADTPQEALEAAFPTE